MDVCTRNVATDEGTIFGGEGVHGSANLAALAYHFGSKEALISAAMVAGGSGLAPAGVGGTESEPVRDRAGEHGGGASECVDRRHAGAVPVHLAVLAAAPIHPECVRLVSG
jgi:hypothetical protein